MMWGPQPVCGLSLSATLTYYIHNHTGPASDDGSTHSTMFDSLTTDTAQAAALAILLGVCVLQSLVTHDLPVG